MRSRTIFSILAALMILASLTASAQESTGPPPCSDPEYRQFDFWIGEWEVTNAAGKVAGTNTITQILGKCALREEWTGAGPSRGTSVNFYDKTAGVWRQNWVDNSGNHLLLTGTYADGKMVLSGTNTRLNGNTLLDRITWNNNETDGTVRQVWDISEDDGKTWKTIFDGLYTRKE